MTTTLKNECYDHAKWQQAEPTSRCLPDNDPRQEWCAYGTLDGVPVAAYWLFTTEQVAAAGEEAEALPWEMVDHIEVDIYSCDRECTRLGEVESVIEKWGLSPAAELGRRGGLKGGTAKTASKTAASRANGAKGGRPASGRQYRVEGVCTTRWYATREAAWRAYQTASERRGYDAAWHCPGEVNGDSWDGCQGYGQPGAVHGVRDGHATITLRIRRARPTLESAWIRDQRDAGFDLSQMRAALEDGEYLAKTDLDQDQVEDLHDEVVRRIKAGEK